MRPVSFFALIIIQIAAVVALANVKFVQDVISRSAYSSGEIWSGVAALLLIFDVVLAVTIR